MLMYKLHQSTAWEAARDELWIAKQSSQLKLLKLDDTPFQPVASEHKLGHLHHLPCRFSRVITLSSLQI